MPTSQKKGTTIPQRWIIIATCFLGLLNAFIMRTCLSIAITQMVVPINQTVEYIDDTCPSESTDVGSHRNQNSTKGETFDWDEKTQGLILSSFYWGYIITCIFGGVILDKIGGKHAMGIGILSTSLLSLLVPKSVEWGGAISLIILRFFTGFGEGSMNPAVMRLMSRWIPEDERSWAAAWAYSGAIVGTIIGMGASGVIIERSSIGWPAMFYAYGAFGIVSFFVHCAFCYDSPSVHPFVSKQELNFLKEKLKHSHADLPPTPWRHIVRSQAIWALLIGFTGKAWCVYMIVSDMPKFLSSVLKLNVETNGYVSSIPHICSWIFTCFSSWVADRIIIKKIATTSTVRKVGNTISTVGSTAFLVVASYVGCSRTLVIGLHVVAMMMLGCGNFSILVNALDLAPNYAGAVQGVIFGVGTVAGFLTPYVVGLLTPNQTITQWRSVFWLIFAICVVTNVVFVSFGTARVQKWNDPKFLKGDKHAISGEVKENITLLTTK